MTPLPPHLPPAIASAGVRLPLLADGALWIAAPPSVAPLVTRWLPDLPPSPDPSADPGDAACIRVRPAAEPRPSPPAGRPTLKLFGVACHVDDAASRATLSTAGGGAWGTVDLAGCRAELRVGDADAPDVEPEVYTMATVAAALLLGRLDRALVHAAAVVGPDGRAWLLAGDTHAGKTTTTANLLNAGWRYVSDDHVVVSRGGDGRLMVEGWPRRFHLDEGWADGRPVGRRGETDPRRLWPGMWLRSAPLAGLLFPRVSAVEPTLPEPIAPADALARLLRQTPWLLADRARTPRLLALARSVAEMPAYSLRLGLDTYRSPAALVAALAGVTGG